MLSQYVVTREAALEALERIKQVQPYLPAIADELDATLAINKHASTFESQHFDYHTTDIVILRDAMNEVLQLLSARP